MLAAARIGDQTSHPGGTIGGAPPLARNVYVEGRPAAVAGDAHVCTTTTSGHLNVSVLTGGSRQVFVGGLAAARVTDAAACGATIVTGASTVRIGG